MPSPWHSSVAAAAFRSEPPSDENCGHQVTNYLAHDPPARLTDAAGSRHRRPPQGGGQAPLISKKWFRPENSFAVAQTLPATGRARNNPSLLRFHNGFHGSEQSVSYRRGARFDSAARCTVLADGIRVPSTIGAVIVDQLNMALLLGVGVRLRTTAKDASGLVLRVPQCRSGY
jgi:hypothetical protein